MSTPSAHALERGLALLVALGEGNASSTALAAATGLPRATVHRLVRALESRGFVERPARGMVLPGPALAAFAAHFGPDRRLATLARPLVGRLARAARASAQLAVLEGDMATYLVKEEWGDSPLFTREGEQLEAYCSGLGKVLLAALPATARAAYLAGGPFVALTARTITDPVRLAAELDAASARGFARDDGEVDEGLHCLAVPVRDSHGAVIAALSLSLRGGACPGARHLAHLRQAAAALAGRLKSRDLRHGNPQSAVCGTAHSTTA